MNDPEAEPRGIKKGSRTKKNQFEVEPRGIKPKKIIKLLYLRNILNLNYEKILPHYYN